MKPRKSFLIRISPELYEAVAAWAQQEFRSVNGQIEYLLREALRRRGRAVREPEVSEPGAEALPDTPSTGTEPLSEKQEPIGPP